MLCPRCKAQLYEGMKVCQRCGFSEAHVRYELKKKIDSVSISKHATLNNIYWKIFGYQKAAPIKKLLKIVLLLMFLVWLFFHFFLYIDLSGKCFITIRPALVELSNTSMKKGLKYLKKYYPNQYAEVCSNVRTISPNISCGGFGGGCFNSNEPDVITISTTYGNYINAAKVIIHETCHVLQFKNKTGMQEDECYEKDSVIPWKYPER